MKPWLFLLLLLPLLARAEMDPELRACAEQDWANAPVHELTTVGQLVEKYIYAAKPTKIFTIYDARFVMNEPGAVEVLRSSTCHALSLSYSLCGVGTTNKEQQRTFDEEADAIRHFLFSAYLACSRGEDFARSYLITHEGSPEGWGEATNMDLYNNYVALDWAREPAHCHIEMTDARMAKIALSYLKDGKLRTIKKGDTLCRDPEKITDFSGLEEKVAATWEKLAVKYPQLCGNGKK